MNNRILLALTALMLMAVLPQKASASGNDFLEKEYHYQCYSLGQDRIHFKIPMWSKRADWSLQQTYFVAASSQILYKTLDDNRQTVVMNLTSRMWKEWQESDQQGEVALNVRSGEGGVIVTSMKSGVHYNIQVFDTWTDWLTVIRKEEGEHPAVTWLEFDWYPPQKLDERDFTIEINANVCILPDIVDADDDADNPGYSAKFNSRYDPTPIFGPFTGRSNLTTPQLYEPYLYQMNENGQAGYGYAAVPYMLYNEPIWYRTSLMGAKDTINLTENDRAGNLYVMTSDTIQENFSANFRAWRNKDTKEWVDLQSTNVDIAPYHRIYDFAATEEIDSTGTFTGTNILNWTIKNPKLKDLIDGDYFIIERALDSTFADAEQLAMEPMVRSENGVYSIPDESRSIWSGNITEADTTNETVSRKVNNYPVSDNNGNLAYVVNLDLHSDKVVSPSKPVYYRIMRASSSVWGWNSEFAHKVKMYKNNYLAPLAAEQEPYTKDAKFDENHIVHFSVRLDNAEVTPVLVGKDQFELSYTKVSNLRENVTVHTDYTNIVSEALVYITIYDKDADIVVNRRELRTPQDFTAPREGSISVEYVSYMHGAYMAWARANYDLDDDCNLHFIVDKGNPYRIRVNKQAYTPPTGGIQDFLTEEKLAQLKDSIYNVFRQEYASTAVYGRSMWDKTARLVLIRTTEETGKSVEIIVPQDSIVRQADGSWIASFTDIADKACTHYSYAVRIDQSRSDLRVLNPDIELLPKPLSGPSLYFDEGAEIASFTATRGDARTEIKPGVMLSWLPTNQSVDEYVLQRTRMGSDEAPATLYTGIETSYFDRSAEPSVHYEYTITANFNCNGKSTSHSATAEGWRTPYGEISGQIVLTDNSGMKDVTVALQDSTGQIIRTIVTDATGAYCFDSLEYADVRCETPQVEIRYTYDTGSKDPTDYVLFRISDPDGNVLQDWQTMEAGVYEWAVGTIIEMKIDQSSNLGLNKLFSFTVEQYNAVLDCHNGITQMYTNVHVYDFRPTYTNGAAVACTAGKAGSFKVVPTSQYGTFSFNYTDAQTAAVRLSADNAVASSINFMNTSCARLSGRVLYKNSTIPVAGAIFLLNGDTILSSGAPLKSGIDGNFEIIVPQRQPNRLQVFKPGHVFEGDGILRVENGEETFALTTALDGVRFYDMTKVRLVGRVAGGNDQRDLPEAFGLGKNNLGEDLQLVLQIEGDNTAHFVHDPDDLTRDSLHRRIDHVVYNNDPTSTQPERIVGATNMLVEKKRITIRPDQQTGEFEVDLFPVRYKVIQATARGYATLFAAGQGNEVFDLTGAPLTIIRDTLEKEHVAYNATYDRIYHNPVNVELVQNIYGMERDGFGEPEMETSDLDPTRVVKIPLYTVDEHKQVTYTLGYPVFYGNRKYQFKAKAYEEYRFNNSPNEEADIVPQRGGSVIVRNGLHSPNNSASYMLDKNGENKAVWLDVDNADVEHAGTNALRSVTVALETEGNVVETNVFSAFVTGTVIEEKNLRATDAGIQLLDIIRDPAGAGSSAWIENGATYTFSFTTSTKTEAGMVLTPTYGKNIEQYIGIVEAPQGTGSYFGKLVETQKQYSFDIPLTMKFDYGESYTYSLTTNEKISTSSSQSPSGVGSVADVFFGTTVGMITGKAKTISIISDSLYQASRPARDAGTMLTLAEGTTADGKPYYLVTGTKFVSGSTLSNTFAYTQKYILGTLIPRLAIERQNLMQVFKDSAEAQATADALGEPVYWYYETGTYLDDTIPVNSYTMFIPNDGGAYVDQVSVLNNAITQWIGVIIENEEDKVKARMNGNRIGVYSTSAGVNYQHSETYNSSFSYNEVPLYDVLIKSTKNAGKSIGDLFKAIGKRMGEMKQNGQTELFKFNATAKQAMVKYFGSGQFLGYYEDENGIDVERRVYDRRTIDQVATKTESASFSFKVTPVYTTSGEKRLTQSVAQKKTQGFTLVADPYGDITVGVYRGEYDIDWDETTEGVLEQVRQGDNNRLRYGSYVYYTEGGSTMCPHEDVERTYFYNEGTMIGSGTEWVAKPEMSADTYEVANVAPDKRATFRIHLFNEGQVDVGSAANDGYGFYLTLDGKSNPDGAKVYLNGAPLQQNLYYWIRPGSPVTQTLEIERGATDDYNLAFLMYPEGCYKTCDTMNLAVHFMPLSTDVAVSMPRQNWVMNTLSPRDSAGYYLPITIDGFDIHHKNFDHIEFQYKLSTQSDDNWVNQCSFYASDSLYQLASGNKAMIENGRIVPFRFYGERDPMEQRYDLRAVSFCRYGSGYVTKTSPVISGTKDTRPPRVFGQPEPANSILGVGDNLLLRFNEPIAGNYLDEDNNFQILGVTNEMGLTATTALQFDAAAGSAAETKVTRDIIGGSFTVDMMIRPSKTEKMELFSTYSPTNKTGIDIFLTADNRIEVHPYISNADYTPILSKPMGEIKEFMRVLVVWDSERSEFRMYSGTTDVTDYSANACKWPASTTSATLVFGDGYSGDMLETRIWTKSLTQEEIGATNLHYLTGYERELAAYYRMNEGRGDIVKDYANGATLYLDGCSWNKHEGFSIKLTKDQRAQLAGNLLGRSEIYDATYMLWFRTTDNSAEPANLFSAGRINDKTGVAVGLQSGNIVLSSDSLTWSSKGNYADGEWHHCVMTINRTFNNAAVYVDGDLIQTFPATLAAEVMGDMYLGGNFQGNIDEFAVFEQALPKTLIEAYDNIALSGDEMGLVGYLPFEEMKLNPNGVLEQVFSVNDRRVYRDPLTLKAIDKVVPLVIDIAVDGGLLGTAQVADRTQNAPVADHGQLTKMNFDWSFNGDELMINLNMLDREINKQSVYVTVRDVEDLNGNPMASPVTWVAFVDRNSLKWNEDVLSIHVPYGADNDEYTSMDMQIVNHSGKRHTYKIESLPDWITLDAENGSIQPTERKTVALYMNVELPVGVYSDLIYLTDEDGLAEPLLVELYVEAYPPYDEVDLNKYPLNMSLCGQVMLDDDIYDTDPNDIVYALYRNECVGLAHITADANSSSLYLTIHGSDEMNRKAIRFQLWQASTGKTYDLKISRTVTFAHGAVYGCGEDDPIILNTGGAETQSIELNAGWNWTSFYLDLQPSNARISDIVTASEPWTEGDIIKNPATQHFVSYSNEQDAFLGHFAYLRYIYTYMIYCKNGNTMYVHGNLLREDSMHVTVRGSGQWSALPCLLDQRTPIAEALAGYYDQASVGDMVKAHDRFAVFSADRKWVGDLQTFHPGEGFFFRRMAPGEVTIPFYKQSSNASGAPKRANSRQSDSAGFSNPNAATNMTMIAKLADAGASQESRAESIKVYVGDELTAVAKPITVDGEQLYFLTIQSDRVGELRFEANGRLLTTSGGQIINYAADEHVGSLRAPVVLVPADGGVYKIIENERVIIIRDGERYDMTGLLTR